MCGITGILRFTNFVSEQEIKDFTDSLKHRGPDGAGYKVFETGYIALGHRRLSILDLSDAGHQPMSYGNGRYWITFNGEIYNFIEVRKDLEKLGHKFKSDSDTEVVLAAYVQWGKSCFRRFNGMWAIGIYDSHEQELMLCRDRFGVKPLHYTLVEGELFAFASETVAFRYLKNFNRRFDHDNLLRAMHRHNVLEPAGETIYKGIKQLLPGSMLIIRKNGNLVTERWWQTFHNLPSIPGNFEDQKEMFLELFADACRLRLRSDVPVASALSGGIDSTAVYSMLSHVMKSSPCTRVPENWQRTFSIVFPGSEVDERAYIESVLRQAKVNGIIVSADDSGIVSELEQSTEMADFISGTPLPCLTYVYKAMHANGIVVSIDGHGVDEYLYGYRSSVIAALTEAFINGNEKRAAEIEQTLIDMSFPGRGKYFVEKARTHAISIKQSKQGLKSRVFALFGIRNQLRYHIDGFRSTEFLRENIVTGKDFPNVYNVYGKRSDRGEQQLLKEFHYIDLPYNLRDFDRGSMQHHIEIRMPFMDYRLVTFSMALPPESKINAGFTKYILREAMKGIMPEDIRRRKLKIGLGAPTADWFNGPLNNFLCDLVNSGKMLSNDILNTALVRNVVEENCRTKAWNESNSTALWPVINYLLLKES